MELSDLAGRLIGQGMFRVSEKANQMEAEGIDVVRLEVGDPNFESPEIAINACTKALLSGNTHYCSARGLESFTNAAIAVTKRSRRFEATKNQIIPTMGGQQAIAAAMACTLNADDTVAIPEIAFPSYRAIAKMYNFGTVSIPLRLQDGFRIRPCDIESTIKEAPTTKMIILNSPANPTGACLSQGDYEQIYELCEQHDLWLMSDEVYSRSLTGQYFFSPATIDKCMKRVLLINSFSKSFSMAGWRMGALTAPEPVIDKVARYIETTITCAIPFIQCAAQAVLESEQKEAFIIVNACEQRRKAMIAGLSTLSGVKFTIPHGGFYLLAKFPCDGNNPMDGDQWADRLLKSAHVAVTPGSVFGRAAKDYVRFSYAGEGTNRIWEAINRIAAIL